MKRGDDFGRRAAKDLLCQVGACSMGNGIVAVKHIELFVLRHFNHFARESEGVEREVEEGIVHHLYFVVEDVVLISCAQPERHCITNKVNAMAPIRQRLSQLRGDHSASTVGGVTRNTDVQD